TSRRNSRRSAPGSTASRASRRASGSSWTWDTSSSTSCSPPSAVTTISKSCGRPRRGRARARPPCPDEPRGSLKLLIAAVGRRMPAWVDAGFDEYARRMPREARIELVAVKPEDRTAGKSVEQVLQAEAKRITAALPAGCARVALDERGRLFSTLDLARRIE